MHGHMNVKSLQNVHTSFYNSVSPSAAPTCEIV